MSEWQPIETAPKDPTGEEHLLGFNQRHGVFVIKYDGWGDGTGGFDAVPWPDHDSYNMEEFKPTHWMPLPAPPANPDKQEESKMTPQDKARVAKAEAYLRMNEKRDAEIAALNAEIESDMKEIAALREELREAKIAGAHAALELAALKKLLSDEQTVGK